MYSSELIDLVSKISDKKYMISLSLNKTNRDLIEHETAWMNEFYPKLPLKIRCLTINLEYTETTFPKCTSCGKPVSYDKQYNNSFNKFCSNKCAIQREHISQNAREKLNNYDWLYQKRIVERISYKSIGELLCCSEYPVSNACKLLNIPIIKLNESSTDVKHYIDDPKFLYDEHVIKGKQLRLIADEIGTSKAILSTRLKSFGIHANQTNSYARIKTSMSNECREVYDYINSITSDFVRINDRKTLNGKEIDLLIPSKNIGFEYNGIYSHIHMHKAGIINKSKSYHLDKTVNAAEKGIKLFHIFSDDWILNKDVVKSMIAAKLGIFENTIYARKCLIVELSTRQR
jgi:hypothetical protein